MKFMDYVRCLLLEGIGGRTMVSGGVGASGGSKCWFSTMYGSRKGMHRMGFRILEVAKCTALVYKDWRGETSYKAMKLQLWISCAICL